MFETALTHLAEWWFSSYFEVLPEGHIRSRTFEQVHALLASLEKDDDIFDLETLQDLFDEDAEVIKSPNSLMKHSLMRSGSRDTSAQLFTALCRALSIPARLVVSLQCVPWKVGVGKPKTSSKKKGKTKAPPVAVEEDHSRAISDTDFPGSGYRLDGTPTEKSEKAKGKEKAPPVIHLRKQKSKGNVLKKKPKPAPSGKRSASLPAISHILRRPNGNSSGLLD